MLPNIDLDTHMISRVNILIGYINILGEEIQVMFLIMKYSDQWEKNKSYHFR